MKVEYHLNRQDLREKNYKASIVQKQSIKNDSTKLKSKTKVLIELLLKQS